MVVFSKNPIHSVLYLILTFFTISGHYILLNAQFLAAVNVIVYAGAIMVLFLFVIMFLNLKKEQAEESSALTKAAAVVSGGLLLVILVAVLKSAAIAPVDTVNFDSQIGLVKNLGQVLFRDFLLPFELASVLFLSAMVGAVLLGKKEEGEKNTF
jgi:NADH-quinone oxidoreductase subunit J